MHSFYNKDLPINVKFAIITSYAILLHPSLFIVLLLFEFITRFGSPLPEGALFISPSNHN